MGPVARSEEPGRPPAGHIALRLPARAEYIGLCRTLAATVGEICRLDARTIVDLKLAVTEACGNAVRHAYRPDAAAGAPAARTPEMELECHVSGKRVAISVRDWGRGVDAAATAGDSRGAGLGFDLIHALTDDVTVTQGTGGVGTTVTFRSPPD